MTSLVKMKIGHIEPLSSYIPPLNGGIISSSNGRAWNCTSCFTRHNDHNFKRQLRALIEESARNYLIANAAAILGHSSFQSHGLLNV